MPARILIIDDEPNITLSFSSLLKDEGHRPTTASSAEEAHNICSRQSFELILLDLQLPGESGLEFLKRLRGETDSPPVLVISGQADIPAALEAVRLGAVDFLEKPVQPEKLITSVKASLALSRANRQRTILVDEIDNHCRIIGESTAIKRTLAAIAQVAPTDTTVLITGENGTGKELVATRLYLESNRRDRPFVRVNCPGIPETLFESELFGHLKGSFTGAVKDHPGKFAMADGGTIFLDEIGDLPIPCQAKLLRVLETGEIETLGASDRRTVDVRVICATNRNLDRLVNENKFRQDLFYRISVFAVNVPTLAERTEDIPLLAGEFLRRFDPTGTTRLSTDALAHLSALTYRGNVRQLKNTVERLTIICQGKEIMIEDLQSDFGTVGQAASQSKNELSLHERLAVIEKQLIEKALLENNGNISGAARQLKVDRANLSKKIKELRLRTT